MSPIRYWAALAFTTCAFLSISPAMAHAEDVADPAASLSRAEAREAAEDVLVDRVGDEGEIRSIRCFRLKRTAARCEARGTLDAANPADGTLRWKAKVRVTATLDELGDEVVVAQIKHFHVGVLLTRERAGEVARARLAAALEEDVSVDETQCRLAGSAEAYCMLHGTTYDPDSGIEEEFEAKVRVKAAASADGTVRITSRIIRFVSWPVPSFDDELEEYGDAFGGYGGGWMPPMPPIRF